MNDRAATALSTDPDFLRFCPQCNNPTVHFAELADTADCYQCGWNGKMSELLAQVVNSGEAVELAQLARQDFVKMLAGGIAPILSKWLLKWGFVVVDKHLSKDLMKYVKSATVAAYNAIVTTRAELAKEPRDGK